MSEAIPLSAVEHHPIGLVVTDDLARSRLTTFFRLILAIPAVIWLALWGIVAGLRGADRMVRGALHGSRPARAARLPCELPALHDAGARLHAAALGAVSGVREYRRLPGRRADRHRRNAEPASPSSSALCSRFRRSCSSMSSSP